MRITTRIAMMLIQILHMAPMEYLSLTVPDAKVAESTPVEQTEAV